MFHLTRRRLSQRDCGQTRGAPSALEACVNATISGSKRVVDAASGATLAPVGGGGLEARHVGRAKFHRALRVTLAALVVAAAFALGAGEARAQTCRGTPTQTVMGRGVYTSDRAVG